VVAVDKTGLTGRCDVVLKWCPRDELHPASTGPCIFTALEEQLGLQMKPTKTMEATGHDGRSRAIIRHWLPDNTMSRSPLMTARSECSRCGRVLPEQCQIRRYKPRSSSLTSAPPGPGVPSDEVGEYLVDILVVQSDNSSTLKFCRRHVWRRWTHLP
jgi:hypothetical protein